MDKRNLNFAPHCSNITYDAMNSTTGSDDIVPIHLDYKTYRPGLREEDALCKAVAMAIQDPLFSDEVLHNIKALRNVYTNAGIRQLLMSGFEPTYVSDKNGIDKINEGDHNEQPDARKYTNWCFAIDLEPNSEERGSKNDDRSIIASNSNFHDRIRRFGWIGRIDSFLSSLTSAGDSSDDEEIQLLKKLNREKEECTPSYPLPLPTEAQHRGRRASAA